MRQNGCIAIAIMHYLDFWQLDQLEVHKLWSSHEPASLRWKVAVPWVHRCLIQCTYRVLSLKRIEWRRKNARQTHEKKFLCLFSSFHPLFWRSLSSASRLISAINRYIRHIDIVVAVPWVHACLIQCIWSVLSLKRIKWRRKNARQTHEKKFLCLFSSFHPLFRRSSSLHFAIVDRHIHRTEADSYEIQCPTFLWDCEQLACIAHAERIDQAIAAIKGSKCRGQHSVQMCGFWFDVRCVKMAAMRSQWCTAWIFECQINSKCAKSEFHMSQPRCDEKLQYHECTDAWCSVYRAFWVWKE